MSTGDLIAILPEAILAFTATLIMLLSAFLSARQHSHFRTVALFGLAGAALAVVTQRQHQGIFFDRLFLVDPFSIFFHLLFFLIVALVALSSADYLQAEKLAAGEYYALLLFATAGMGLMSSANDLVLSFIGLEISSLASYVLVGFRRGVAASSESALKYFLLGSFATAFFLYGIALLYGATGSTQLLQIREALRGLSGTAGVAATTVGGAISPPVVSLPLAQGQEPFPAALLGLAASLLFVGLAFKVSAAPFQVWTPDVYQGAPTPVTAFLSTGPKAAALAVFLRIFLVGLEQSADQWSVLLWLSAALSMFIGNLAALWQSNMKRLLAYSSIAHAGYMLVAFTAHSADGAAAVLFYLVAYALMNLGAFLAVIHVGNRGERYIEMDDYAGLGYRSPVLAACLSIFLLSLIGIPLTGGFLGKFYVFRAALRADLIGLTILGVVNSAIAAYYYLRIVVAMYMTPSERPVPVEPVSPLVGAALAICAAGTFLLGVYPQSILRSAEYAARSLLGGG
ncbi:MAG: NADH-quinone oxidoreductase subunit N [Acidobacteria bacterium]|nr:NADH-quinone oxidoreductase subunit N [Acidobacteriota bacterium]